MVESIINEINSKDNVLILGFGREGKSTYNLIRKYLKDKKLVIADGNDKLLENNSFLKDDNNLEFILGDGYLDNLSQFDMIIKSPGVNFKHINYDNIRNKITSEIDLFLKYSNCMTIGVTGTKGKSTTSSLVHHILKGMNKNTRLVGNIGIPVFDEIESFDSDTLVVIELSCHQLQFVNSSPNISVLLNVYEEHLDLYKSFEEYKNAKLNIFKYQKEGDHTIIGIDSPDTNKYIENRAYHLFTMEDKSIKKGIKIKEDGLYLVKDSNETLVYEKTRERNLLGDHNLYNVAASLIVCDILSLDMDKVKDLVDSFQPLEHRMEKVGTYKGITFYNDSIATIPEATINCVKSIPNTKTLIIGGLDRGLDLKLLVDYIMEDKSLENIICLKDTGYKIADELEGMGCNKNLVKVSNMEDAVRNAYKYTKEGSSCVLSPAAASYNVYKNFEERGKDYKRLIKELG